MNWKSILVYSSICFAAILSGFVFIKGFAGALFLWGLVCILFPLVASPHLGVGRFKVSSAFNGIFTLTIEVQYVFDQAASGRFMRSVLREQGVELAFLLLVSIAFAAVALLRRDPYPCPPEKLHPPQNDEESTESEDENGGGTPESCSGPADSDG